MPPKRKGGAAKAKAGGKKAKIDSQAAGDDVKSKMAALKAEDAKDKSKKKKTTAKVDSHCTLSGVNVFEDYDCMLNQTNISQNNNKFYVIQLLQTNGENFYLWTRWGRVGEPGANKLDYFFGEESAKKAFGKKFTDKTKNKWENRTNFVPAAGKYTLIEVEEGDEEEIAETVKKLEALDETDSGAPVSQKVADCTLDTPTQKLMKLIFDNDMFQEQMTKFELDVKKMPLGKLSKGQIAKGFEALEEIEEAIQKKTPKSKLAQMSSKFYTLIPHSFGRKIPPTIDTEEIVRAKMDMLLVLADIEVAQSMQKEKKKPKIEAAGEVPHPLDVNYGLLKCELNHVKPKSSEYKIIDKYVQVTKGGWRDPKLLNVWSVDREGEDKRFSTHDALDNRRLLWHGTNVAVVAAILKSGLRIMPHSGGRVGRGIYFASEHSKSAGYVGCTNKGTGIMFLNEVALGKEKHITQGDGSLRAAPKGFDSIVARGMTEPDPKHDTTLTFDGNKVAVPQGKPVNQSKFNKSHFSQSEYLIYKESQNRMRYLLEFKLY